MIEGSKNLIIFREIRSEYENRRPDAVICGQGPGRQDRYEDISGAGYTLIGISKDSEKSHSNFRAKYELPFTLLSDTDTSLLQSLGAWGEKKLYGKISMGTLRRTYVFSEEGVLERIIEKVDTKNAAAQLLEEI